MVLRLLKMLADAEDDLRGKSARTDVARLQVRILWALWTFPVASSEGSGMFPPAEGHCGHGRAEVSRR